MRLGKLAERSQVSDALESSNKSVSWVWRIVDKRVAPIERAVMEHSNFFEAHSAALTALQLQVSLLQMANEEHGHRLGVHDTHAQAVSASLVMAKQMVPFPPLPSPSAAMDFARAPVPGVLRGRQGVGSYGWLG